RDSDGVLRYPRGFAELAALGEGGCEEDAGRHTRQNVQAEAFEVPFPRLECLNSRTQHADALGEASVKVESRPESVPGSDLQLGVTDRGGDGETLTPGLDRTVSEANMYQRERHEH